MIKKIFITLVIVLSSHRVCTSQCEIDSTKYIIMNEFPNADSLIKSNVMMNVTIFNSRVNFSEIEFYSPFHFDNSKFNRRAEFYYSVFKGYVGFPCTEFKEEADFLGSRFNGNAFMGFSKFYGPTNFRFSIFDSISDFTYTSFFNNIFFDEAVFNGSATFNGSVFNNNCSFKKVKFKNVIAFTATQFKSNADFSYSSFDGDVYFNWTLLPNTFDFSNVKEIKKEIDLTSSYTRSESTFCYINLFNSDISKIKIDYYKFRLYFSVYDHTSFDQKAGVYNSLLEKFRKDGFTDSYRLLDLEFREILSNPLINPNASISDRFFYFIQDWWWEFGYKKVYIFGKIFFFISIFTIIIFANFNSLMKNVYEIEFIKKFIEMNELKINQSKLKKSFYIGICSLVYCLVIFFGFKLNFENIKTINAWLFYIFFVYAIGLICTAYLFNFIISK